MTRITSRWDDSLTLYECGVESRKEAVEEAVVKGVNLSEADLSGADLRGADLRGAYLSGADLSGADLRGAYLSRADLSRADLSGADLRGADLSGADLSGANLSGADLSGQSTLQLGGSRHWIVALRNTDGMVEVSIGCRRYSLERWLDSYEVVGKREGYTEKEIVEYGAHLRYIEQWAKEVR